MFVEKLTKSRVSRGPVLRQNFKKYHPEVGFSWNFQESFHLKKIWGQTLDWRTDFYTVWLSQTLFDMVRLCNTLFQVGLGHLGKKSGQLVRSPPPTGYGDKFRRNTHANFVGKFRKMTEHDGKGRKMTENLKKYNTDFDNFWTESAKQTLWAAEENRTSFPFQVPEIFELEDGSGGTISCRPARKLTKKIFFCQTILNGPIRKKNTFPEIRKIFALMTWPWLDT